MLCIFFSVRTCVHTVYRLQPKRLALRGGHVATQRGGKLPQLNEGLPNQSIACREQHRCAERGSATSWRDALDAPPTGWELRLSSLGIFGEPQKVPKEQRRCHSEKPWFKEEVGVLRWPDLRESIRRLSDQFADSAVRANRLRVPN